MSPGSPLNSRNLPKRDPAHRNLAKRLLSGAAWAFAGRILGLGSSLLVNAILARMLPPDEMGAYFLVLSITAFACIVARFGLKQTVVRLVAESMAKGLPGRAAASLKIVYIITALGALLVGGVYHWGLGRWLAEQVFNLPILATVTGLTALWTAALAFQTPVAETFRGLHDIRLAVFLDGILASILLAVTLFLLWTGGFRASFAQAVALTMLAAAAGLIAGTVLFLSRARSFRGEGSIRVREVISISAPVFVVNLAAQAMTNVSLWIVAAFAVAEEVALYGAAWKLVNLLALPLMLMDMSVQPVIVELHVTQDKQRLQNVLRGTATLAVLPAVAILLAFIAFGSEVLATVYGPHYRDAALVLAILSAGQLANVWSGSCGQVLIFAGHQRELMKLTVGTSIVTVVLSLLGAHLWGMLGVASATAAGRILHNVVIWLQVRRLTGLWTHATLDVSFIRKAAKRVLG
jgi:O-antigen/teichoic acid export membrane protein